MGKEGDSSRGQGLCRVPEEASLGSSPLCDARIRQDWQRLTPVRAGGTWQQLAAGGAPAWAGRAAGGCSTPSGPTSDLLTRLFGCL